MSYEGYQQVLCPQGHLYEHDAYNPEPCPYGCSGSAIWTNEVDETNGGADSVIPEDLFLPLQLTPPASTCCATCGQATSYTPATYRRPTVAEHKAMRRRKVFQNDAWQYLPMD